MKKLFFFTAMIAFCNFYNANGQWTTAGANIYNSNTGNVGIGNNAPSTLLYVAKSMIEPTITVRNLGGSGGATYTMIDDASGANWKFKATLGGGFKIRDHANLMDVITIEPNSFANAICIKTTNNIGIGTAMPDNSALVDMTSASKGFLLPRMTQEQIGAISSPADGLLVYCTTDSKLYIYSSTAYQWKELALGSGMIAPPFSCGMPITVIHLAGNVAPVDKTVTYSTVTSIPGELTKCWITSNLGADHQATAANDATEESAGWYWQFNRQQGYKHTGSTRTPNTTWLSEINENSDWLPANDPCALLLGTGWRLPTSTEWTNVDASGGWTNSDGPWNSALKMHAAGFLSYINGSLPDRGSYGRFWSSTQNDNTGSFTLKTWSSYCYMESNNKASGYSSRCLRD